MLKKNVAVKQVLVAAVVFLAGCATSAPPIVVPPEKCRDSVRKLDVDREISCEHEAHTLSIQEVDADRLVVCRCKRPPNPLRRATAR